MTRRFDSRSHALFQVWVAECDPWRPRHWYDTPKRARVVEPADGRCLRVDDARQVAEGFNRCMLREGGPLWAVLVPVTVRIKGRR